MYGRSNGIGTKVSENAVFLWVLSLEICDELAFPTLRWRTYGAMRSRSFSDGGSYPINPPLAIFLAR